MKDLSYSDFFTTLSTDAEIVNFFEWGPTNPADERVAISAHEGIRYRSATRGAIIIERRRFRHQTPYYRAGVKKEPLNREKFTTQWLCNLILRAMLSGEADSADSRIGKAEK